jgi:hypothetical protein
MVFYRYFLGDRTNGNLPPQMTSEAFISPFWLYNGGAGDGGRTHLFLPGSYLVVLTVPMAVREGDSLALECGLHRMSPTGFEPVTFGFVAACFPCKSHVFAGSRISVDESRDA